MTLGCVLGAGGAEVWVVGGGSGVGDSVVGAGAVGVTVVVTVVGGGGGVVVVVVVVGGGGSAGCVAGACMCVTGGGATVTVRIGGS